jgi:hypothetical protein
MPGRGVGRYALCVRRCGFSRWMVPVSDPRRLVYVSGAPGSGKTSLAVPLAAELGCALLAKDRIKETLHDALGAPGPGRAWSRRLGAAAMELLWALAADAPAEVHCACPPEVAAQRYNTRVTHPVHVVTTLHPEQMAEYDRPVGIGALVTVDTTAASTVRPLTPRRVSIRSTLGDPLTDLGLLLFYWREPGEDKPALTPALTRNPGFPKRAHLAEHYARRTGAQLDDIAFYDAFAHFKFAVIAQGIAARVAAGSMAGQDFGNLDQEVLKIAEEGLSRLQED